MKNVNRRRKGENTVRKIPRRAIKFRWYDKLAGHLILWGSILIVAIFLYFPVYRQISSLIHPKTIGTISVDRYRDLNAVHLRFARRNGITPFKSDKAFNVGINDLLEKKLLVKIENNRLYTLKRLTHSHPYLTPKAAALLDDIGKRFRKKLEEIDKPAYYFQVSSLLRTGESQRRLGRSNRNASENSSHLYGTTFDVAYKSLIRKSFPGIKREVTDGGAIKLLSEAIGELRNEGRCKVVTEYNEKCFHITVVK